MPRWELWTDESSARLVELSKMGLAVKAIAEQLTHEGFNITRRGVDKRLKQLEAEASATAAVTKAVTRQIQLTPRPAVPWPESERACVFPIGHVGEPDFRFCGEPKLGRAYCAVHAGIAYRQPDSPTVVHPA